ncbi:sulfotransferase family 2 domain-containing protein [Desulfuromonas sp. TF]|uniref:sulfotransferase family 2 domain-containing protein n=1 Tax=Desulfuromonas sp. TF TaxID=1232410 RepID=UPI0009E0A73F|nr:sulfotransferase family 2 domain-containing protein [Desulfuromonas sp. TF]
MEPKMKYFFLHVSKTAGTSLRNALREKLPPDEFLIVEGAPSRETVREILEGADLNKIRLIGGHIPNWTFEESANCTGQSWVKFAVLREPFDRLLSLYHYLSASDHPAHACFKGLSIAEFCEFASSGQRPDLNMCYSFSPTGSYDEAHKVILDQNIAIYTIKDLENLFKNLRWKLKIPLAMRFDNKSKKTIDVKDVHTLNTSFLEEDIKLYKAAEENEFSKIRTGPIEKIFSELCIKYKENINKRLKPRISAR